MATAAPATATCDSCVFFEDHSVSHDGLCRFNPPAPVVDDKAASIWPTVKSEDWCGQHTVGRH